MKRIIKDKNKPIGKLTIIKDFLPSPQELIKAENKVKVTIELEESTVTFFKQQAKKHNSKYQRMMRELLHTYAKQFNKKAA